MTVLETIAKLVALFGTSFVIGLSGALMPGPMLAVAIGQTPRGGAKTGPLLVLGHALLEGVLVAGLALGLAAFLADNAVIGAIGLGGGAMLLFMGQGMIRSARGLTLAVDEAPAKPGLHPVVAGVVASVSNPYWFLWWATIGISYIVIGRELGWAGVVAFFLGHILADLAWYTAVSVGLARGRRLMSDGFYRGLIVACGVVLVVFGLWFFWAGAGRFGWVG
jgi:threonine/homoserine/homoserine lactone efflux protein